jgi:hypothetical protein
VQTVHVRQPAESSSLTLNKKWTEGGRRQKLEDDEFLSIFMLICKLVVVILAEPELRATERTALCP